MTASTPAYDLGALLDSTRDAIRSKVPAHLSSPRVGIVCGSGLSTLAEKSMRDIVLVPYSELPGFGESTVQGHKSLLAFGLVGAKDVPAVAMLGRFHPYEGHPMRTVIYPIRVMAKLGVKNIIITNAAGALNPDFAVGTIVAIQDHIALPSLTGMNPLLGAVAYPPPHPRFLPLSNAHSRSLRRLAFLAAHELSFATTGSVMEEGVYGWVSGPTYETAAEGRFLRAAGADVVGMSTIPEVVAAREEGMEVLVLSLVTNKVIIPDLKASSVKEEVAAELAGRPLPKVEQEVVSHEEVLRVGKEKAEVMRRLVEVIVDLAQIS